MNGVRLFFSLVLLLVSTSFAQAAYLAGCWRNVRNGNRPCYIEQNGNQLIFTNENGSRSYGELISDSEAVAFDWGYLHARLAGQGYVLLWDGNGEWDRDYSCD